MPYGIPSEAGGESLSNTAKMEACVEKVMSKGQGKETAIRICKTSLGFTNATVEKKRRN